MRQARPRDIEAATAGGRSDDGERNVIEGSLLVYVIHGMAIEVGMDLDSVLAEVRPRTFPSSCPTAPSNCARTGRCSGGPNFFALNIARGLGLETDGEL